MRKRNHPCPCGSGLKYKRCCRDFEKNVNPVLQQQYAKLALQQQESRAWEEKHGRIKPFITSVDATGHRYVAIGSTAYISPEPGTWISPAEFLSDYVGAVLDHNWANAELDKGPDKRHIVAEWRAYVSNELQEAGITDGAYSIPAPTGTTEAYISFAWDLYILGHNSTIPESLIQRLKQPKQFQGAYYEVTVAAMLLRGGFSLDFEDETDSKTTHHEFQAINKRNGVTITVEAKSRHRAGALGWVDPNQTDPLKKIGIRNILRGALSKSASLPTVFFIDLNLPTVDEESWNERIFPQLVKEVQIEVEQDKNVILPNTIFFTNISHHYNDSQTAGYRYLAHYQNFIEATNEANPSDYVDDIRVGIKTYGAIPVTFD